MCHRMGRRIEIGELTRAWRTVWQAHASGKYGLLRLLYDQKCRPSWDKSVPVSPLVELRERIISLTNVRKQRDAIDTRQARNSCEADYSWCERLATTRVLAHCGWNL